MDVLQVNPSHPEPSSIGRAAAVLERGGLVAFPTETVYGLGANALDTEAVARIYEAKGRPGYNPLIAHCLDAGRARELAAHWPAAAETLARRFWPGPLTLIVHKSPVVPGRLTAGLETVALRVPSHPVARALLGAVHFPIAAPSANRFTELSPTAAGHVQKGLAGRVDLLLDAGETSFGIESTVVDLSGKRPRLLRPGAIGKAEIEEALGEPLEMPAKVSDESPRPGPGMVARHYSPRARLRLLTSTELAEFRPVPKGDQGAVGGLLIEADAPASVTHPMRMPPDPAGYGRRLYSALHDLDDLGCAEILVEAPPMGPAWAAIHDRLQRAAHEE